MFEQDVMPESIPRFLKRVTFCDCNKKHANSMIDETWKIKNRLLYVCKRCADSKHYETWMFVHIFHRGT